MRRAAFFLAVIMGLGIAPVTAEPLRQGPVVVELFTSQGCSSCPPADALLHDLTRHTEVLPLALHVDYWDYIGWADEFARADHTRRQKAYAHRGGRHMIYTPQMVIMGQEDVVGADAMAMTDAIRAHEGDRAPFGLEILSGGRRAELLPDRALDTPVEVVLVRYVAERSVKILRGELAGHHLSYANVVTDMVTLAQWDGRAPLLLELPERDGETQKDTLAALLIQEAGEGRILLAARLP